MAFADQRGTIPAAIWGPQKIVHAGGFNHNRARVICWELATSAQGSLSRSIDPGMEVGRLPRLECAVPMRTCESAGAQVWRADECISAGLHTTLCLFEPGEQSDAKRLETVAAGEGSRTGRCDGAKGMSGRSVWWPSNVTVMAWRFGEFWRPRFPRRSAVSWR